MLLKQKIGKMSMHDEWAVSAESSVEVET